MDYPTRNNRLLYYKLYDTSQTPEVLLRTVTYTYYDNGDASNITVKDEDPAGGTDPAYDWHQDLALYYWGDHTLRAAWWGRWQVDGNGDPIPGTYDPDHAREFHYDRVIGGPRARDLAIDFDTPDVPPDPNAWVPLEPIDWTDYAGMLPYADADVTSTGNPSDPWAETETMRHLFAAAQQTVATGETQYYHGDLIDSTMLTTDAGATAVSAVQYTAFGEILDSSGSPGGSAPTGFPRYQYAGAWGYESGLLELSGVNPALPAITLQHVGHRWYQPDAGRFVQRDPIGIRAGPNVYAYAVNRPTLAVDPLGLWSWENAAVGGAGGFILGVVSAGGPSNPAALVTAPVGFLVGGVVGGYEEGDLDKLLDAIERAERDMLRVLGAMCLDHLERVGSRPDPPPWGPVYPPLP